MIISALILLPLLGAAAAYFSGRKYCRLILIAAAVIHAVLCGFLPALGVPVHIGPITLTYDSMSMTILAMTSLLFMLTSLYLFSWLPEDEKRNKTNGMRQQTFVAILLLLLCTMTLTAFAEDFGMLWVAVEATTLASAPLINFRRTKGPLEAMWKYLLLCSVGIGLALFGTMLIASALNNPSAGLSFALLRNISGAGKYNILWFKTGFVFCFAGYALKMGLAPFHTWLPDTYSEAPAPVSALLSGGLINCALLAVIRLWQVTPVELRSSCGGYLKFFGFFSLAVAAFFIVRQKDFKRMLAYSSVEHMGLIALLLATNNYSMSKIHVIAHSLIKMSIFLLAGNIQMSFQTRSIAGVRGLFDRLPVNGALWIGGLLLICGTPPSPLFFTELQLVTSMGIIPGAIVLLLLLIIFCGMAHSMLRMTEPAKEKLSIDDGAEKLSSVPGAAITLTLMLGIAVGAMYLVR